MPVFDGASSTEIHEHYDPDGTLTGHTVVTKHSDWDDEARAWALGLTLREAGECRRCGDHLGDTTDYERNKYVAQPPVVCLKCLALHNTADEYKSHPESAGMIHQVKRVDRPGRG